MQLFLNYFLIYNNAMTEHQEQVITIKWFRLQYPKLSNCLWAIPNGGVRNIGTAIKLKSEGVLAGVPDLFLMIPKNCFHGLFIEMKIQGGKLQPNQKEFLKLANALEYKAVVCYGFEEAKKVISDYLKD
jgi:hypothetical protein